MKIVKLQVLSKLTYRLSDAVLILSCDLFIQFFDSHYQLCRRLQQVFRNQCLDMLDLLGILWGYHVQLDAFFNVVIVSLKKAHQSDMMYINCCLGLTDSWIVHTE